jgi:hypothetical protein
VTPVVSLALRIRHRLCAGAARRRPSRIPLYLASRLRYNRLPKPGTSFNLSLGEES